MFHYNWPWNKAPWVDVREQRHIRDDVLRRLFVNLPNSLVN